MKLEEPCEGRLSSTVPWERKGENSLRDPISCHFMKQTTTIIYIIGLIALGGCENKSSKETYTYPSNNACTPSQNNTLDTTFFKNNSSTFNNPSFHNSQIQYRQTRSSSLQDFWDEAEDVRNDAESVLSEAENIGCDDAVSAAQIAISNSDDCTSTKNYSDAASYLDDAQSELSNAQSYLEDCQNSRDNNNDNEENEDDEDE